MNIIGRASRALSGRSPASIQDVQAVPVDWSPDMGASTITVKVDHVVRLGHALLVAGWSTGPGQMRLRAGGNLLDTRRFETSRGDVARYLGRVDAEGLGFVLLAMDESRAADLELQCLDRSEQPISNFPLVQRQDGISADARALLEPALESLRQSLSSDPKAARQLESTLSHEGADSMFATGVLDEVMSATAAGPAVASGWLVRKPGVDAWLEDMQGRRYSLDEACWVHRGDVVASVPSSMATFASTAGFLVLLEGVMPTSRIRLMAKQGDEAIALAQAACTLMAPDPVVASRHLFEFPTPITEFAERVARIDLPLIEPLARDRQDDWSVLPVRVEDVGPQPDSPKVSIVIPLYGRLDFVEHQLIEFARDPWLIANAQIIYVVDDVELVDVMAAGAWSLARLYGVPFRWLWGGANRGFSGANNLGTAHARGKYMVFLNSDAFPQQRGWLEHLIAPLQQDAGLGAVGPRLVFGDGSIQHAGMEFRYRDDLGIWTNHHPGMGLDPALDPSRSLTDVACITGACMAVRMADLERVGGWDAGYLIGDFEDSDLCLKLRAAGLRIGYLPDVQLTHLERQSFKSLGKGDFRMRVVIYNAVRHQQRWKEAIEAGHPTQEERLQ